jgi:hypothetical protein
LAFDDGLDGSHISPHAESEGEHLRLSAYDMIEAVFLPSGPIKRKTCRKRLQVGGARGSPPSEVSQVDLL